VAAVIRLRHPSRQALQAWLDGREAGLDDHLAQCARCATLLEHLDEAADHDLADALATVYSPPDDLSERLQRRVTARLDSRVFLGVVGDLFGAALETSMLLLTEEPPHE
jgi:hypothetical protein